MSATEGIEVIQSENAPKPFASYSQGYKAAGFVFVSGHAGLKSDGTVVTGDVKQETEISLANLKNILEAGGSCLEKVVKVNIFLTSMELYADFNEVYDKFFPIHKPPRSCVGVKELPKGFCVEIECTALA